MHLSRRRLGLILIWQRTFLGRWNSVSYNIERRDELRRLSESRMHAGYPAFPSADAIDGYAKELGISKIEAHQQLMELGELEANPLTDITPITVKAFPAITKEILEEAAPMPPRPLPQRPLEPDN
jgi:hypothetical protein